MKCVIELEFRATAGPSLPTRHVILGALWKYGIKKFGQRKNFSSAAVRVHPVRESHCQHGWFRSVDHGTSLPLTSHGCEKSPLRSSSARHRLVALEVFLRMYSLFQKKNSCRDLC